MSAHTPLPLDLTLPAVVRQETADIPTLHWVDQTGRQRVWESCERTTRKGKVDAVAIAAIQVHPDTKQRQVIIIKQFRPPVGKFVLEMPAGLIDDKETPAQAASRELKEETGFVGVVVDVSPVVYSDPGLSNANMQFVHINVDANCLDPKQALEDGEFVDVMKMPYDNLLHHLLDHAQASGCVIDARLYHYAVGLHLSSVDAAARSTTRAALPFFLLGAATALGVLFAARALLK